MIDMVTFGEAMASLRGPGPLRLGGTMRLSIAGAESNVAIGLARLGHRARWVGRIGDDEMGALVVRTLRAEGVDTSSVVVDADRATGLLLFERRVRRDRPGQLLPRRVGRRRPDLGRRPSRTGRRAQTAARHRA